MGLYTNAKLQQLEGRLEELGGHFRRSVECRDCKFLHAYGNRDPDFSASFAALGVLAGSLISLLIMLIVINLGFSPMHALTVSFVVSTIGMFIYYSAVFFQFYYRSGRGLRCQNHPNLKHW